MRLLKSIWLAGLIAPLSLLASSADGQAKQVPPPPAKKAPAPQKSQAAKQTPPAKAAATAPKPAAGPQSEPASTEVPGSDLQPGNRRDPFASLVSGTGTNKPQEPICRAPGKGGIVVETMVVDGIARSANAVVAVVRTPQQRVYFLREGDRLCDGRVERITLDGINLRQTSRDAFGKPIERIVSKRIFPSAGE